MCFKVVWEIEPDARAIEKATLPAPTGFDSPPRLDAFLDAMRWGASSLADPRSVQAPFRSGIDIEDYQLDPVVRAVQMPRANLLIADDVGLGKNHQHPVRDPSFARKCHRRREARSRDKFSLP